MYFYLLCYSNSSWHQIEGNLNSNTEARQHSQTVKKPTKYLCSYDALSGKALNHRLKSGCKTYLRLEITHVRNQQGSGSLPPLSPSKSPSQILLDTSVTYSSPKQSLSKITSPGHLKTRPHIMSHTLVVSGPYLSPQLPRI